MARGCAGSHDSFRSCWTRFNSWTGYWVSACECDGRHGGLRNRKTLFQFLGGLLAMSSECAGLHAKSEEIVDQVQFLARTLLPRRWSQTARQPAATRSKRVRLPPASLTI